MKDKMLIKEIERLVKENKELEIKCKKKDELIKGLENELWEYEEDYDDLEEEIKELDKECYKLEEENSRLIKEIIEIKNKYNPFKVLGGKEIAEKMDECINPNIIKLGMISMKSCLDTIELFEKEIY